jgi:hypothetical protein
VALLFEYIRHHRFIPVARLLADGTVVAQPEHPNLCMKGRKSTTLLGAMERWQLNRNADRKIETRFWEPMNLPDLELPAGLDPEDPEPSWCVKQLTNSFELAEDGLDMGHCVGDYTWWCIRGWSSIWSVRSRKGNRLRRGC